MRFLTKWVLRPCVFIPKMAWQNLANLRYLHWHNVPVAGTRVEWLLEHRGRGTALDLQRAMTDYMVSAVGLTVVDEDKDTVPCWIIMTPRQRKVRKQVTPFKLGLRNATRSDSATG